MDRTKPHRLSNRLFSGRRPVLFATILLFLASGCATTPIDPDAMKHIVMVNGRGDPVNPDRSHNPFLRFFAGYERFDDTAEAGGKTAEQHFTDVLKAMEDFNPEPCRAHHKRKVLIFIHGGLNSQTGTIERASELHRKIEQTCTFPLFINWQSSLISSYTDHLLYIRQGQWKEWYWIPFAPFYLAEDLIRSIGRLPTSWTFMFLNDLETMLESPYEVNAGRSFRAFEGAYKASFTNAASHNTPTMPISGGHETRTIPEKTASFVEYVLTLPTKLLIAPMLDAMGKSSWDVMNRRTHMLFHKEGEFVGSEQLVRPAGDPCARVLPGHHGPPDRSFATGEGGLTTFLCRFRETIQRQKDPWEITLVGHSMGSIVMNEMLRRFPDVHVDNIVYMGAAARIRDYEDSLFPYLEHPMHQKTNVYHLLLHQEAESRDRWIIDLPPRGSLLVWIDNFLSKPETHLDRTVGRWPNFVVTLRNTPMHLRNRIHVKSFDVGNQAVANCPLPENDQAIPEPCYQPQKHGDFTNGPFWNPAYWQPRVPNQ